MSADVSTTITGEGRFHRRENPGCAQRMSPGTDRVFGVRVPECPGVWAVPPAPALAARPYLSRRSARQRGPRASTTRPCRFLRGQAVRLGFTAHLSRISACGNPPFQAKDRLFCRSSQSHVSVATSNRCTSSSSSRMPVTACATSISPRSAVAADALPATPSGLRSAIFQPKACGP